MSKKEKKESRFDDTCSKDKINSPLRQRWLETRGTLKDDGWFAIFIELAIIITVLVIVAVFL